MRSLSRLFLGLLVAQTACSGTKPTEYVAAGGRRATIGASGGVVVASGGASGGVAAGAGQSNVAGAAGSKPFGPLGVACDATHSCEGSLHCYAAGGDDFPVFSPAGGFCTISCKTDADCSTLDATAHCVEWFIGEGTHPMICAPGCALGDDNACGRRDDLACWPISQGTTGTNSRACLPNCNHDDQCPEGTVCDGYYNLCASEAPSGGLAIGATCDPFATDNPCAEGFCIELDEGGACTAYCRRGTFPQCGGDGEDTLCGWVFAGDEAAGLADIGMCALTCACDSDCTKGSHCVAHPDRAGMAKPGICTSGTEAGIATCR